MRATAFVLMLAMPPWGWSETRPEPVSVISTAFADTQSAACVNSKTNRGNPGVHGISRAVEVHRLAVQRD